jgi:hypothetical protein
MTEQAPSTTETRPPLQPQLSSIEVAQLPSVQDQPSAAPSESHSTATGDGPRRKRRSGGSVDLTYRYHEPSDDELSWTEDEHGTRRRRKSHKKKSSVGDDFRTGIV